MCDLVYIDFDKPAILLYVSGELQLLQYYCFND